MKALVCPVATYDCEIWTPRKNEETDLGACEMKGLRKILRVSWTARKTNEWVLHKAGVKRELLDTVKAKNLAYYSHTMRKQRSCLEKEIMQGAMPGARRRGRPCTAWVDSKCEHWRLFVDFLYKILPIVLPIFVEVTGKFRRGPGFFQPQCRSMLRLPLAYII